MSLVEETPQGEGTLIAFYQRMAAEIDDAGREALNHIAQALLERGWVPSGSAIREQLAEIQRAHPEWGELNRHVEQRRVPR